MDTTKRIAIYARVSTSDQTADNQLLELRRHCASHGWTIVREFVDHAVSGSKKDRPHLRELMEFAWPGDVDCVLVWRFDRFARSMSHLVEALEEFRERRIDFASHQERIDTGTSQGKLMFGIFLRRVRAKPHSGTNSCRSGQSSSARQAPGQGSTFQAQGGRHHRPSRQGLPSRHRSSNWR